MNETTSSAVGICQLTTGHSLDDERILYRMAWSTLRAGYRSQIAGPGKESSTINGIPLVAVYDPAQGWFKGRLVAWLRIVFWALRSNFRIFQFHDPDLVPAGLILRLFGRKVIYDVHDDYQASFETRTASIPILGYIIPKCWWFFERNSARFFNGVIVADRYLAGKFAKCNPTILGNYPSLNFTKCSDPSDESTFNLLYVGGVSRARGVGVVLDALRLLPQKDIRLHVVGACRDDALHEELKADSRVVLYGQVDWTDLHEHYEIAHLGLAIYQPLPGFVTVDHSVKIVEYMAAGIPVITSNFPGLTNFVVGSGFGMVIDPECPQELVDQIETLYGDIELRKEMGRKGRGLFEDHYNWENLEPKLFELLQEVSGNESA